MGAREAVGFIGMGGLWQRRRVGKRCIVIVLARPPGLCYRCHLGGDGRSLDGW